MKTPIKFECVSVTAGLSNALTDGDGSIITLLAQPCNGSIDEIVVMVNAHGELQDLLRSTLTMLGDLSEGYPWRELHIDLETISCKARLLGVEVEVKS